MIRLTAAIGYDQVRVSDSAWLPYLVILFDALANDEPEERGPTTEASGKV